MNAAAAFEERYGRAAELEAEASGRVNLIGEHTDYNGGWVLPMSIPQSTRVGIARQRAPEVHCASSEEARAETYLLGEEQPRQCWVDYVQGVTRELAAAGQAIGGAQLCITSQVPVGAGLSSSAALTVAVAKAFRALYRLDLDDRALAMIAYRAEHDFVGVPIGVMDPMAVCFAEARSPILLNTRSLAYERLPWPAACDLLVLDSGVQHDHATGGYLQRRRECVTAAAMLGVDLLCDAADDARAAALPEPLRRRVRHVLRENARVLQAVTALREGDALGLGRLFDASHASLRDDFEVSVPAVDALVDATRRQPGCLGTRLTGGGFGGAVVALVRRGSAPQVAQGALAACHAERLHGGVSSARPLIVGLP